MALKVLQIGQFQTIAQSFLYVVFSHFLQVFLQPAKERKRKVKILSGP